MVEKAKKYIRDGDIIQVVLSGAGIAIVFPAFDVYRRLRSINPSPYMFFLGTGRYQPDRRVSGNTGALRGWGGAHPADRRYAAARQE